MGEGKSIPPPAILEIGIWVDKFDLPPHMLGFCDKPNVALMQRACAAVAIYDASQAYNSEATTFEQKQQIMSPAQWKIVARVREGIKQRGDRNISTG